MLGMDCGHYLPPIYHACGSVFHDIIAVSMLHFDCSYYLNGEVIVRGKCSNSEKTNMMNMSLKPVSVSS